MTAPWAERHPTFQTIEQADDEPQWTGKVLCYQCFQAVRSWARTDTPTDNCARCGRHNPQEQEDRAYAQLKDQLCCKACSERQRLCDTHKAWLHSLTTPPPADVLGFEL